MLFFINKSNPSLIRRIALVGGDEDKILLLVGDGVCFAAEYWQKQFEALNVEEIYAEEEAIEARNIAVSDACETVSYARIADILFDNEQVVSL